MIMIFISQNNKIIKLTTLSIDSIRIMLFHTKFIALKTRSCRLKKPELSEEKLRSKVINHFRIKIKIPEDKIRDKILKIIEGTLIHKFQ